MGRWAWSSDTWDFDQDGYPDLYVANGYISGPDQGDLGSFFWRQVVGKSPDNSTPSLSYERGWNALNELIRSDASWSGYERNLLYLNNHDGTFSDISGVAGMDFPEDSRSFVLADLDRDGRLEVVLKNRNAPQLRVLRNAMKEPGQSIVFRLRGTRSNRDAIGTAVSVEADGRSQTKYLQAGSGFLAQHSKELFFGMGKVQGTIRASIRWPSGLVQNFENLPVSHRFEIEEGSANFATRAFATVPPYYLPAGDPPKVEEVEELPLSSETWLTDPLSAPDFSLPDLAGNLQELRSWRGGFVLLSFWSADSGTSHNQLRLLQESQPGLSASGLRVAGLNVDDVADPARLRSLAREQGITFPLLLATQETAGIYNIIYRYLFDRRRDLAIPTSFLVDKAGIIIKVYQGVVDPKRLIEDVKSAPATASQRAGKAFPLGGTLFQGAFQRNDFTYGVAFFQHGYLEQAAASFRQVIESKPDDPEAYYNLGTLELRRNSLSEARKYLEQAVKLRDNYPEAWNNLGMIAAQQGQADEAVRNFQRSLSLRPTYATALLNLGNLYRRQGALEDAETLLKRALDSQPQDPEVNYGLGMFYATQGQLPRAEEFLAKAANLRPGYPEALNNLGVLFIREQKYSEAQERFKSCIQAAPNFDQAYLNLARLYAIQQDKEKARETLQALLRLQPEHKIARQALEMLQ